jgi:hypothetical protein
MRDSAGFRLPSALLVLACLAGCATAETPITGPVRQSLTEPAAETAATPAPSSTYGFLDGVGLTAPQQAAIKAIAGRHQSASALSDARTRAERFRALMTASTLDQAALATFLREGLQAEAKGRAVLVTDYMDVRAVLTDAQRVSAANAILAQLNQPQTSPSAPPPQGGQNGQGSPQQMEPLTAQQQALFAATITPPPDPRAVIQGIAALMRTGDKGALEKALAARVGIDAQVAALVKAFASLNPTQRRQLVGG